MGVRGGKVAHLLYESYKGTSLLLKYSRLTGLFCFSLPLATPYRLGSRKHQAVGEANGKGGANAHHAIDVDLTAM